MSPASDNIDLGPAGTAVTDAPRILVIQVKRIGDLVVSAPSTASLRRQMPDAHITVLARGVAGKLGPLLPGVDECLVLQEGKCNFSLWMELLRRHFDLVLDLSANDRSECATLVAGGTTRATFAKWQSGWLRRYLYNAAREGDILQQHMTDFYLGLLEAVGLLAERVASELTVPDDCAAIEKCIRAWRAGENGLARKFAVVHPGTAERNKYWQPKRWAAVIDHLAQQHDCAVIISRGNDSFELEHIAAIKAGCRVPGAVVSDDFITLRELVVVVQRCDLIVGVDTGAMHIAATFETPQVALFGPSNSVQWGPRYENSRVLLPDQREAGEDGQSQDMVGISAESVIGAVDELLPLGSLQVGA